MILQYISTFLKKLKKISKKVLTKKEWSDIIAERCEKATERSLKIEQWKLRETFKLRDNLMYKDGTLKILLSLDTQNEVI